MPPVHHPGYATDYLLAGVLDSSGVKFIYTDESQQQRAGVLVAGYDIIHNSGMIIPPGRDDFTITGLCPRECTQRVNTSSANNWINRSIK